MAARRGGTSSLVGLRPMVLGAGRIVSMGMASANAAPVSDAGRHPEDGFDTPLWIMWTASIALVLIGGVFAGLTIALMGQDSIYLQVLSGDPTEPQHKNAKRVLSLLKRGKHWVLVTLLLSNVIVNESLPVVLDRTLGGGVAAVVGSTVLIVIFGEIVPQSVCVRYGLPIGGYMSKPVMALMYFTSPISWPTAKLLDWILGEDHGTVYKKSGLKTLVTLHKSLGELSERLNQDEVTIITAVLDLKEKPVSEVMTPMDDVFTLSEDHVLDEKTMDKILSSGYSRIPIYRSGNPSDFVGMLLVKTLITYDPEDRIPVRDVQLGAIVETRPETSCLDIINFFQEGKSHMVLVSEVPGSDHGALGVVTLEDVIEELIGEEIVDESDVYVDVHKAIRRLNPAPRAKRINEAAALAAAATVSSRKNDTSILVDIAEDDEGPSITIGSPGAMNENAADSNPPRTAIFMKRRSAEGPDGLVHEGTPLPIKASLDEMKQQLRLGPANRAQNPLSNKREVFKIKQGLPPHQPTTENHGCSSRMPPRSVTVTGVPTTATEGADERMPLLGERREDGGVTGKANGHPNGSSERK